MTDTGDDRVERLAEVLFHAAADLPSHERAHYVRTHAPDAAVRARAELLLAALGSGSSGLDGARSPSLDHPAWTIESQDPGPPDIGSNFQIVRLLGEGGFGSVWLAEQLAPLRRAVAVKVIKPGMDSRQVLSRFRAERQALAMMDHPGIATVFEAGTTALGHPYFVMEYIRGPSLLEYCDSVRLDTPARLRLFLEVCRAVEHAHQKGVIHRDLKPSNVLIESVGGDGAGSRACRPKVIDFGVAKAVGAAMPEVTAATEAGGLIGTPTYMSPEQADGAPDIDTRSDIYALGVILYELLCGAPPFEIGRVSGTPMSALEVLRRRIREEDPVRPSTRLRQIGERGAEIAGRRATDVLRLRRQLHGDLDWIVSKALEKDRARRYATVGAFVEDIERHLDHRPVLAGPPDTWYVASKTLRRHRTAFTMGGIVAAALLIGLAAALAGLREANRQRALAEDREREGRRQVYSASLAAAMAGIDRQNAVAAWAGLELAPPELRGWEWRHLAHRAWPGERELRLNSTGEKPWCEPLPAMPKPGLVFVSTDGGSPGAMVWDTEIGQKWQTFDGVEFAVSPDGLLVAVVEGDGSLRCVERHTATVRWSFPAPARVSPSSWRIARGAFSPDNRTIAAWDGQSEFFVERSVKDGSEVRRIDTGQTPRSAPEYVASFRQFPVYPLYFWSKGQPGENLRAVILGADYGGTTSTVWPWLLSNRRMTAGLRAIMDHTNGRSYAVPLTGAGAEVLTLTASRDGSRFATGDGRGVVTLWSPQEHTTLLRADRSVLVCSQAISSIDFAADGSHLLVTAGNTVRLVPSLMPTSPLITGPGLWLDAPSISPDGTRIARAEWGMVGIEDAATGTPIWRFNFGRGLHRMLAWASDCRSVLALSNEPPEAWLLDAQSGRVLRGYAGAPTDWHRNLLTERPAWLSGDLADVAFGPGDATIVLSTSDGAIRVVDAATWFERREPAVPGTRVAMGHRCRLGWSPGSDRLSHIVPDAGRPGQACLVIRDAASMKVTRAFAEAGDVSTCDWTADGSRLAIGLANGEVQAWNMGVPSPELLWRRENAGVGAVGTLRWSPDGTRIVVLFDIRDGIVLSGEDGRPLLSLSANGIGPSVMWTDDGETLCIAAPYGRLSRFESTGSIAVARKPRWSTWKDAWPVDVGGPPESRLAAQAIAQSAATLVHAALQRTASTRSKLRWIDGSESDPGVKRLASIWIERLGLNVNYANSSAIFVGRDNNATPEQRADAAELLEEAAAIRPFSASILGNLAWAHYRAGNPGACLTALERLEQASGCSAAALDPPMRLLRAMASWRLGLRGNHAEDAHRARQEMALSGADRDPDSGPIVHEWGRSGP